MSPELVYHFVQSLLCRHSENDRQLPWKLSRDPYRIWLSEIILQQTRVAQGLPYYERFIHLFPTVFDLASADESEVFKAWEGLGYYSRARNLHQTAREVAEKYSGHFPDSYEGLLTLKGIGPYTAAAIASFAFDLPYAVLDGNVFRVLSRFFGIDQPIDQSAGRKHFQYIAECVLPANDAARFNQAIMDFGAMQCVPQNPNCTACSLQSLCVAFQTGRVKDLPFKSKRLVKQNRYLHFFEVMSDKYIWIEKRSNKDIWQGLFQFPLIESAEPLLEENSTIWPGIHAENITPVFSAKQQLTHRTIYAVFYQLEFSRLTTIPENWIAVEHCRLNEYPFPGIIHNYMKNKRLIPGCGSG